MQLILWAGFILFVLGMLALDLGVLNRGARVISTRAALMWSGFCCLLALGFNVLIYFIYEYHWWGMGLPAAGGVALTGRQAALDFFTAWLIEQTLSLDNIFVIALIFTYFNVPREYQHRTLFWGVMGALLMRGVMIWAGVTLIHQFEWIIYIFGALLVLTALRMFRGGEEKLEPEKNPLVRLARRFFPVSGDFDGEHFFTSVKGVRHATPLFLALLMIESTDLLFAVDSIPAVLAITNDAFIVFTSNIFAILNLRSLYFALAGMLEQFKHLKVSLIFILLFVGLKMMLKDVYHIPTEISLSIIGAALIAGIAASRGKPRAAEGPPPHCAQCGYSLFGNSGPNCPECGAVVGNPPVAEEG